MLGWILSLGIPAVYLVGALFCIRDGARDAYKEEQFFQENRRGASYYSHDRDYFYQHKYPERHSPAAHRGMAFALAAFWPIVLVAFTIAWPFMTKRFQHWWIPEKGEEYRRREQAKEFKKAAEACDVLADELTDESARKVNRDLADEFRRRAKEMSK